ncbi:MAG: hypothetical protein IJW24_04610 [Clostridia bacterium]|nr:hypothetical protein [Clostridia bacterium]
MAKTRAQYNMSVEDFQKAQITAAMLVRGSIIDKRKFGDDEVYFMWSPLNAVQIPVNKNLTKMECVGQASHLDMDQEKVLGGEEAFSDYFEMVVGAYRLFPSSMQEESLNYHRQLISKIKEQEYFKESPQIQAYINDVMMETEKVYAAELEKTRAEERQG